MTATILIASVFLLLALVFIPPLRLGLLWVFDSLAPHQGIWAFTKTVLHSIFVAHVTVLRNLQPRSKVLMELRRSRTSYSEE